MATKSKTIFLPRARLGFSQLLTPDFKFKKDGEYHAKVILPQDDFLQSLEDALVEEANNALAEKVTELNKALAVATSGKEKGKIKEQLAAYAAQEEAQIPIKPVFDDNGDPTSDREVKASMPASYKDKKTQKVVEMKPGIVDGKGKSFAPASIWGGSEVILAVQVRGYVTPLAWGAKLSLKAVQVIKLVEGGGGNVQFAAVEDGIDGSEYEAPAGAPVSTGSSTPADEQDDDSEVGPTDF